LLDRELQLAREVQQTLFPQTLNLHSNFQLAVRYVPHHQIGGDYYDFFKIDNQNYGIVIGDVSGKGISAALLLANFQANLRLLFENKFSLSEIVKQLNKKVIQASGGNRFITIFIGIYNTETQQLKYINAGHVPPFLFTKGKFVYLREGTTGLGMVDEIPFIIEGDIRITYGDILCMFTDGLTELKLPDGNYISELQIEQFIKQNYMQPVQILEKNLYRFIKRSTLNQPLSDDLTFVICKFTP
jgi:sigma-B regulation protein RsbU (phosphoserine phosphatase)